MPSSQQGPERSFPVDRSTPRASTEWFRGQAQRAGWPPERLDQAELCLDELVTNVVRYGGAEARPVSLTVSLRREPEAFLLEVDDDGRAFDPRHAPAPIFAPSLAEAPDGGRGVFLILSIADELRYERRDGRNRVTLVFRDRN